MSLEKEVEEMVNDLMRKEGWTRSWVLRIKLGKDMLLPRIKTKLIK